MLPQYPIELAGEERREPLNVTVLDPRPFRVRAGKDGERRARGIEPENLRLLATGDIGRARAADANARDDANARIVRDCDKLLSRST